MTEKTEAPDGSENSPSEMRSKLIKRLAVAGVLVASLLGMLAFFDYLATAPEEPEAPVFTRPVPVTPKKEVSQPVTPATNLPEPPTPAAPEPVVEAPPAPVIEAPQPAGVEAKPGIRLGARPNIRPEIRPLAPSTAATAKAPVPATPSPPPADPSRPVPEATASPTVALAPAAPVAKPSARAPETKPAPALVIPSPPRLFAGFLVQAGVFTSAQRAEELHAKLTLSGIPSSLEARVQVGPFRTRQEAEIAQAKLRELGVDSVLLPPKGAKH